MIAFGPPEPTHEKSSYTHPVTSGFVPTILHKSFATEYIPHSLTVPAIRPFLIVHNARMIKTSWFIDNLNCLTFFLPLEHFITSATVKIHSGRVVLIEEKLNEPPYSW